MSDSPWCSSTGAWAEGGNNEFQLQLRASLHIYTTEAEVDRLADKLGVRKLVRICGGISR